MTVCFKQKQQATEPPRLLPAGSSPLLLFLSLRLGYSHWGGFEGPSFNPMCWGRPQPALASSHQVKEKLFQQDPNEMIRLTEQKLGFELS